ncbi:CYTH domain-containing protein [Neopusillimonas aromaticivorans]|uniref:CYTH domain-containing protein n=1 Tax=Neopusillimonas aromaticivorans TaxID=2979868 RepID=UPI002596C393|nr:CYTH domain-containing protein [Neopusillimonas aromaticivorans]WJJ94186.1 CYTH domain-containing protein [Neopusillimonas aromaticivorans]
MTEREIKLHVPDSAKAEIARHLRVAKARRITLQAKYFDTPERELANAGIALRIRKEGRRWVQTVKAPGTDALSRLELNHLRSAPELDLALYTGTALEPLFAALKGPLCLRYETKVTRQVLPYEADGNAIEIAYDQGPCLPASSNFPSVRSNSNMWPAIQPACFHWPANGSKNSALFLICARSQSVATPWPAWR